jgi:uncharacterized protein
MIKLRRAAAACIAAAVSVALAPAAAQTPLSLAPPGASGLSARPHVARPNHASTAHSKPKPHPPLVTKGMAIHAPPAPERVHAAAQSASPARIGSPGAKASEIDDAYGAFQRGYYLTAFALATKRIETSGDAKSMTLLGELYAQGFGVSRDDNKAAEWYRLAAERGDREAMFQLAMFRLGGRAGAANRQEAADLLARAAMLGYVPAAYDLGLLYLEGQLFPQDFARAAELFRSAAQGGSPEAQYALATLYKEGRGVAKDVNEAARLLSAAAAADYTDAQVEFAIALFNGTGVTKDESAAAALLKRAARKGNPIAQNRLASILSAGRGLPRDPVEAIKWHLISKAGGETDLRLDDFMNKQPPEIRAAGEKAAQPYIEAMKASRS